MKLARRTVGPVVLSLLAVATFCFLHPTPAYTDASTINQQDCFATPSALVSWWDGDRVSGSTVFDVNQTNDGSMLGGVSLSEGIVGNAFSFDGSSGRVNVGNPANLNFGRTDSFSLEAWLLWDGGGSSINNVIRKSNYPVFGPGAGYWLRIDRDHQTLEFFTGETTGALEPRGVISTALTSGVWHHVVGTRDTSGTMKLYLDGELKAITQAPNANTTSEAPFVLGAWDDRFGLIELFSGLIDEISVYNRDLAASEVQAIFNTGSAGKCKTPPQTVILEPDHGPPGSNFTLTASGFQGASFLVRFGDCSGNCINLSSGPCPFNGSAYSCLPSVTFNLTVPNFPPGTYSVQAGDGHFLFKPFTITSPTPTPTPIPAPPTITIAAPLNKVYLLNEVAAASYSCSDAGSGVATCAGPVPSGSYIDTASVGTKTFTVSSADNAGHSGSQSVSYTVSFRATALFDQTKAVKSGSVIPIKVQLVDGLGRNVSSASVALHAVALTQVATNASEIIADTGSSNADLNFRFDSTFGSTGGYIFNLKTTGLTTGTYRLDFVADGDPTAHSVLFQVRQ